MSGLGIPELLIMGVIWIILIFLRPGNLPSYPRLKAQGSVMATPSESHLSNWVKLIILCALIEGLLVTSGIDNFSIITALASCVNAIVIYHLMGFTYLIFGKLTLLIWIFLAMPVSMLAHQLFYMGYYFISDGILETERLESLMDPDYVMRLTMAIFDAIVLVFKWPLGLQQLETLIQFNTFIVITVVIMIAAYKLIPKTKRDGQAHPLTISTQGYGGRNMKEFKTESTRLAAASAVLNGRMFRQKVLEKVKSNYLAVPVELGLDYGTLVSVCRYMDKRQVIYDSLTVLLVLGLLVAAGLEIKLPFFMSIIAVLGLQLYEQFTRYFQILPHFKKDRFNPETISRLFDQGGDDKVKRRNPSDDMNVVVYHGFLPFIGTGLELGGWTVSVDITRPSNDISSSGDPIPFEIPQLYETIDTGLMKLDLDELELKNYLFINGSDIPQGSPILPDRFAAPTQTLSEESLSEMSRSSQYHNRLYKWIKVRDWGDEIVVSFLIRCTLKGNNLFIELTRFLLTPVGDAYRKVDQIPEFTFATGLTWFIWAVIKAPFLSLFSVFSFLGFIQDKVSDVFQLKERRTKKRIKTDPNFNYGVAASLREEMSSKSYLHYFQKIDKEMYEKMFDRQILNGIVDFLEAHHIDTADLKERQSTILNTGIIVQKGDVTAQSLAVGKGAKAGIVDRFRKAAGPVAKQSQGGK